MRHPRIFWYGSLPKGDSVATFLLSMPQLGHAARESIRLGTASSGLTAALNPRSLRCMMMALYIRTIAKVDSGKAAGPEIWRVP
jgi:hypothetical protein